LFEGASRQPARDGGGHLLHLIEVHSKVGAGFTVRSVGDNLAPLVGQFLQRRQLLG
jgi:hypothetical protein